MGDGKTETKVPKALMSRTQEIGDLRLQSYDKDEIHIHGPGSEVFKYKGKRNFQLAMDRFIRNENQHQIGTVCFIPTTKGGDSDLVLTRTKECWAMTLAPAKKTKGVNICDDVITTLDEFIQRL